MKVFVALILTIASVTGLGSGPYLPSGWRPQGPAFFLPGEQEPQDNPPKETLLETEASASDLREYGPPKVQEVFVNAVQALPDEVTERTFFVVETVGNVAEVSAEQKSVQEATEAIIAETVTEVVQRLADIPLQDDVTSALYETEVKDVQATTASDIEEKEAVTEVIQGRAVGDVQAIVSDVTDIEATSSSVEVKEDTQTEASLERLEQIAEVQEKTVEEVKNVAEILVNLENEIKSELVANVESSAEVKINHEGSGATEAIKGFLEYGPPGFREYGPPKGDELLRSAAVQESAASVESNEARRRRFSPKFRATKGKRRQ